MSAWLGNGPAKVPRPAVSPDDQVAWGTLCNSQTLSPKTFVQVISTLCDSQTLSPKTFVQVISTLCDRKKRNDPVPYRDSKLTQLLMDSIGGKS
jgi:hypothetical protein